MTQICARVPRLHRFRTALAAVGLMGSALLPAVSTAQVANRLMQMPTSGELREALPGSVSPRVKTAQMLGHLSGETTLPGMSLVVAPSAAQQAELTQLLQDQQDPASPRFHKWLTPETYGKRFGLSDADLSLVQSWLTSRGFTVESVAASRNRIVFSGTASAAEAAFGTTLQRFHRDDQDYFENNSEITLPASLANVVAGVTGLSSFHMAPPPHTLAAVPQYTSSAGNHYIVPWDFRQIFGVNTLISQGFDGTGVKIGVIGQSTVDTNQLTYFQQKISQTVKLPTMVLVPNTGTPGNNVTDEQESELDLEYASGSAPGATVLFIYTGSGQNNGVFDALSYAVTSNQAPILTLSYGGCESQNAAYATRVVEPVLAQASSQGQTIIVSSGDTGAASCEPTPTKTNPATTTAQGGLSVSYPASSPNVTAVGGTQLNSGPDPNTSSPYWSSTNNSFKGSAVGYMPEIAWNDTGVGKQLLSSTGGGASAIFGKPSWQAGTGVPADSHRDLPDVAFPAAVEEHAYLVCIVGATCQNNTVFGTSDPNATNGTGIGGTSAAAPNFAALLAVVEQATSSMSGLGNINSKLYTLAASSNASTIFHDITSGNNIVNCAGGTTGCSSTAVGTIGTMGYSTTVGYDLVTGLGSLDAVGLAAGLTTTPTTKLVPTITLGAATTSPAGGSPDLLTLAISGTGVAPTGTITLAIDGTTVTTFTLGSATNYTYTYNVPACTATIATTCPHSVVATYGGDGIYNAAVATVNLVVPTTGVLAGISITIAPASSSVSVTKGGSVTNAINVTSSVFVGTVTFTASSNMTVGCYSLSPAAPTITAAGGTTSTTMTIYTSSSACTSTGAISMGKNIAANHVPPIPTSHVPELTVVAAGFMGAFMLRRRRIAGLLTVLVAAMALGLSGCGGGGTASSSTVTTAQAGSYTVNVMAKGTTGSGFTAGASTSFTVVVN